jgi:hypothetical protein
MTTNVNVTVRCTNKNLMTGMVPPGGGAPVDQVNASMVVVADPSNPTQFTGTLTMTYPLSADVFQIGNYYALAMTDTTAPTSAHAAAPATGHPATPPK